jgi:hypothetical protein
VLGWKAPGQYRLKRANYVLEFWNGDGWRPKLLARARTSDNKKLLIASAQLTSCAGTTEPGRWKEFDYYVPITCSEKFEKCDIPAQILLTIEDPSQNSLGAERILLRLRSGRFMGTDGL